MRETLGFHPIANTLPFIEGEEFDDLVADVKENGIKHPIMLFEGLILDGRNRYRAAEKADVAHVPMEVFEGTYGEAIKFVVSENFRRRHMTDGQRTYAAAQLSNLAPGRPSPETPQICGVSVRDASKMLNVKQRNVEKAKAIQRKGSPELNSAVQRGLMSIDMAVQASRLTVEIQAEAAKEAEAGRLKNLRTILKRASRTQTEQILGSKISALPTRKYGVILADPEWRFEPYSRETGMDRAPENHYPTSVTDDIVARPVGDIAAEDCILFLWATSPMLPDALRVMAAWGFTYKSHQVWRKNKAGTGYWFRNLHELLLVGTKGNVPAPAPGSQELSVLDADVTAHSRKPECFAEWIEREFPNVPKIELNARDARLGWDVWGNEAPGQRPPHDPETGEVFEDDIDALRRAEGLPTLAEIIEAEIPEPAEEAAAVAVTEPDEATGVSLDTYGHGDAEAGVTRAAPELPQRSESPRASDGAMEIPAFLRRTKTEAPD